MFGKGLRGLAAPAAADRLRQRGHARAPAGRDPRGPGGQEFELTGDESLSARPMGRIAEPLGRMGAGVETTEGHLPMGIQARPLSGDRLRAARRERAGQVGDPPGGPLRDGRDDRGRAGADARPHRADARRGRRGRRGPRRPASTVSPAERLRLDEVEVPGDFSSAAPFLVAATLVPGSELHVHGVNLNPRRTGLLEILERMGARDHGLQPARDRRRARRRPRGRLGAARRDLGRGGGGAARDRRAAPRRARRRLRARGDRDPRRGGAARQGDRPDRGDRRRAARARRSRAGHRGRAHRDRRAGAAARRAHGEPRRPPARDARRRRGPRVARGRADRGRRRGLRQLPRVLRDARRAAPSSAVVEDDRR